MLVHQRVIWDTPLTDPSVVNATNVGPVKLGMLDPTSQTTRGENDHPAVIQPIIYQSLDLHNLHV